MSDDNYDHCDHDFAWDPVDGLDGMCRNCGLYVMKPNCIEETSRWFKQHFGDADPLTILMRQQLV